MRWRLRGWAGDTSDTKAQMLLRWEKAKDRCGWGDGGKGGGGVGVKIEMKIFRRKANYHSSRVKEKPITARARFDWGKNVNLDTFALFTYTLGLLCVYY